MILPSNQQTLTIQELSSTFSCHSNMAWNVTKVKRYIQVSCTTFVNIWIQFDISTTFCDEIPLSSRTAPSRPGGDVICDFFKCSHRRSVTSTTHKGATKDCNRQTILMVEVWDRKSANCRPFLYHSSSAHLWFRLGRYGRLTLLDYIALHPRR
jgi:hypothetical protein